MDKVSVATIADAESAVFVSAASAWETSIKKSLGKLETPADLARQLERHRFQAFSITVAHALAAGSLPHLHDDPVDCMLIAQARLEDLTVVTRDPRFKRYQVSTLPARSSLGSFIFKSIKELNGLLGTRGVAPRLPLQPQLHQYDHLIAIGWFAII